MDFLLGGGFLHTGMMSSNTTSVHVMVSVIHRIRIRAAEAKGVDRNAVAAGKLRDEVWQKQQNYALNTLPPPFAEIVSKIKKPFVQTLSDAFSPQASFFDGKVLLVGDALSLFRPHAALSTDQAAMNCLALEKVMKGEMKITEWEREVLGYAYTTWLSSRAMGSFYQLGPLQWIPRVLQVLVAIAGQRISKLWYGSKL